MSTFNPTRAVLADDDDDGLDDFMASLDAKAKKFRSQVIADAFKELASSAKAERKKLVEDAVTKVAELLKEERLFAVQQLVAELKSDKDRLRSFADKIASSQDRLTQTLSKSAAAVPDVRPIIAEELASALGDMRTDLKAAIGDIVAKCIADATPPKPTYKFKMHRDEFTQKISEVTATPQ